jgi:hypothetical protein
MRKEEAMLQRSTVETPRETPHETPHETPRERSAYEDLRVLASLAALKDELGDSDAGHEIERALVLELEHIERKLRDTVRALVLGAVDEARLQAHLGVLEAHDRVTALEPIVRVLRTSLTGAGVVHVRLALAAMELNDVVDERRRRAREEIAHIERATEHALERLSERIDALTLALRRPA